MTVLYHYNPDLLTDDALRGQFVVRTPLLTALTDALAAPEPGHHLVVGPRGMGKTTLLRRVHLAVREDPALAARWLPLAFPEEQYNVASLADFWANCADALADTFERTGRAAAAAALDARVDALDRADGGAALELLVDAVRAEGRGLVLLVDNLDIVLSRLDDREQWELRAVLGGELPFVLIGASADLHGEAAQYGKPFYEFLRVHALGALTLGETNRLLAALAERAGGDHAARLATVPAGRIRALHTLTGGNPRTVGLLFEILTADPTSDAEGVVNALLDRVTPLYKDRFEALPEQLQRVLDAVALIWHPAPASEIAARVGLPVNHTSAALARLMQLAVVEQVPLPRTKRAGFQVAERFFNVWYLMRASRRLRRKLGHLVRFMEALWGDDERQDLARRLLDNVASLETSLAVAQTTGVRDEAVARALVARRLREIDGTVEALHARVAELVEPGEMGLMVRDAIGREALVREAKERVYAAEVDWAGLGTTPEEFWEALAGLPIAWAFKADLARGLRIDAPALAAAVATVPEEYRTWSEVLSARHGARVAARVLAAFADGTIDNADDIAGAAVAAAGGNPWPAVWAAGQRKAFRALRAEVLEAAWADARAYRDPAGAGFVAHAYAQRADRARSFAAQTLRQEFMGQPAVNVVVWWVLGERYDEAARVLSAMPSDTPEALGTLHAAAVLFAAVGDGARVQTVIEDRGLVEVLAPLVEALRVRAAGDPSLLDGLAPELRAPTEATLSALERYRTQLVQALELWTAENVPEPPLPEPPPRKSPRAKR